MDREQGVSILLLVFIVASSVVPLAGTVSASQAATKISDQTIAADEETMTVIVPVMEDESVANSTPDQNFDGTELSGGLFVGLETAEPNVGRSWLKYNLQHLPRGVSVQAASLYAYMNAEYTVHGNDDVPIGVYYSSNDTWSCTSITWNTQPAMAAAPSDIIDSPASPNMFVPGNWYSWDVTSSVHSALSEDGILTEVLRVVDESASDSHSFKYFIEQEFAYMNSSYLIVEYTVPAVSNLQVDGWSTAPQIDYIQNAEATLGWQFSDDDTDDYQKYYEVDVRTGPSGTGGSACQVRQTDVRSLYWSASGLNFRPFCTPGENRYQLKIDSGLIPRDGILDKIYIQGNQTSGELILKDLEVYMVGITSALDLVSDFATNYEGMVPTCVLSGEAVHVPIVDSWIVFDLENTFMVSDRVDLLVEFRFTDNLGAPTLINYTTLADSSVAYSYGPGAYHDTTANQLYSRMHNVKFEYAAVEVFGAGVASSPYPFGLSEARMQFKYDRFMIGSEGLVDRIFFGVAALSSDFTLANLSIYLVETPLEGFLTENFQDNYGGATPTLVFQKDEYSPKNMGRWLVFDVDNAFYYHYEHDLLIEIAFDARVGTALNSHYATDLGGYRLLNNTDSHSPTGYNTSTTYEFALELISDEQSVTIESPSPLVNGTQYYYRVRTCDSLGIWTSWHELPFRYNPIIGIPTWSNLAINPSTARVGSPVTISIDVEYFLGISEVSVRLDGTNHTMSHVGDTYSYTWSPSTPGTVVFKIYMKSYTGHFNFTTGSFVVVQSIVPGIDDSTLFLIVGVIGVVLVGSAVVCIKKR